MKKFEYTIGYISEMNLENQNVGTLKSHGETGWEIIAFMLIHDGSYRFVAKREIILTEPSQPANIV